MGDDICSMDGLPTAAARPLGEDPKLATGRIASMRSRFGGSPLASP
jgi:hypothetical protein